jgi:hypothetical protein
VPDKYAAALSRARETPRSSATPPVRRIAIPLALVVAFALVLSAPACADDYSDDYAMSSESPLRVRGLLDTRVVHGSRDLGWTDRGPGKTRYGGNPSGDGAGRDTRLVLSHLTLEVGGSLPFGLVPRAQIELETDADSSTRPLLIETFLRREWGSAAAGFGVQVGTMNPPLSLEHRGPAWTPAYTLTPSALGTWQWEEMRSTGVEGDWWRRFGDLKLDLIGGAGFGSDDMGALLAQRGWVLSDYLSGVNVELPLPTRGRTTSVFDERDGRPALYARAVLSDRSETAELQLGYFDNLTRQTKSDGWSTRFGTVGALARPLPHVTVAAQYMEGETNTEVNAFDSAFRAVYALLSLDYRRHRLTARYDFFRIDDHDGPPITREHGWALAFAYLVEIGLRHRLGIEYLHVWSHRAATGFDDPSDGGWQFSYRFRY